MYNCFTFHLIKSIYDYTNTISSFYSFVNIFKFKKTIYLFGLTL